VCWGFCRDSWDALLLHSLLLLRAVCQRLKLYKESLLHSLEIASLADSLQGTAAASSASAGGLLDHDQAQGLASAALLGLLAGPQDAKSSLKKPSVLLQQQPGGLQGEQQPQQPQQQQQQQQQVVAAQGSPVSSPRSGTGSDWEYVVQQVDLSAALQQQGALKQEEGGGGTPRSQVAELLSL
jgi:hypothetical protein